jgi:hypothetical protein
MTRLADHTNERQGFMQFALFWADCRTASTEKRDIHQSGLALIGDYRLGGFIPARSECQRRIRAIGWGAFSKGPIFQDPTELSNGWIPLPIPANPKGDDKGYESVNFIPASQTSVNSRDRVDTGIRVSLPDFSQ